jgi:hypothetical protein
VTFLNGPQERQKERGSENRRERGRGGAGEGRREDYTDKRHYKIREKNKKNLKYIHTSTMYLKIDMNNTYTINSKCTVDGVYVVNKKNELNTYIQ